MEADYAWVKPTLNQFQKHVMNILGWFMSNKVKDTKLKWIILKVNIRWKLPKMQTDPRGKKGKKEKKWPKAPPPQKIAKLAQNYKN